MKRRLQITISLVFLFCGSLVSTFSTARFCAWSECDARYKAFINQLDQDGELRRYFHDKGRDDYYENQILIFHPSGRWYSGSNDSGLFIVGGGAVAVFGAVALLDAFRRRQGLNN
jgi:hypothetical protein